MLKLLFISITYNLLRGFLYNHILFNSWLVKGFMPLATTKHVEGWVWKSILLTPINLILVLFKLFLPIASNLLSQG